MGARFRDLRYRWQPTLIGQDVMFATQFAMVSCAGAGVRFAEQWRYAGGVNAG